MDDVASPRRFS